MHLSEIKLFKDKHDDQFRDAFLKLVHEKGLKYDSGNNARVVWIEGKSWVWRSWFNDDGYEAFLEYVAAHKSNPHLPKILSRVRSEPVQFKNMPKDMTIKYVKLERLEQLDPGHLSDALDTLYLCLEHEKVKPKTVDELSRALKRMTLPDHSDADIEDVAKEVLKYPGLFSTYLDLVNNQKANDISSANVMMRGDVPVIIDPFSA